MAKPDTRKASWFYLIKHSFAYWHVRDRNDVSEYNRGDAMSLSFFLFLRFRSIAAGLKGKNKEKERNKWHLKSDKRRKIMIELTTNMLFIQCRNAALRHIGTRARNEDRCASIRSVLMSRGAVCLVRTHSNMSNGSASSAMACGTSIGCATRRVAASGQKTEQT